MKFFRNGWAKYEEAKPGTLKLIPPSYRINGLKRDYDSMRAMLFGTIPSFDGIIKELTDIETEINKLGKTQK